MQFNDGGGSIEIQQVVEDSNNHRHTVGDGESKSAKVLCNSNEGILGRSNSTKRICEEKGENHKEHGESNQTVVESVDLFLFGSGL